MIVWGLLIRLWTCADVTGSVGGDLQRAVLEILNWRPVNPLQCLWRLRLAYWSLFDVFEKFEFVARTLRKCRIIDDCAQSGV
ncbi:hypothetical protein BGK55_15140 [Xanthomonas citri pv. malvacearum]|nr:hypothetical protein BGK55_15140 [Xanthomonas citri pv. malvacearum]AZU12364.1 hypothetical protein AC609_06480 [Xanthomonas phaseoli pv. phaseoli]AZU29485.1 hypothetical protein AC801_06360 [Xanthomonas sp. ISO98C4]KLB38510.1 hypothetical protein XEUV206_19990 [Xanthomonas euvesicatoria]ASN02223.1 hypothetical protein APY29_15815 [Xanthomonas citri pv. malvacearum]